MDESPDVSINDTNDNVTKNENYNLQKTTNINTA